MENNRGPKVHTNYIIAPSCKKLGFLGPKVHTNYNIAPSCKKLGFIGSKVHTNYNIAPPSSKKPVFFGSFALLSPWDVTSLFVK